MRQCIFGRGVCFGKCKDCFKKLKSPKEQFDYKKTSYSAVWTKIYFDFYHIQETFKITQKGE